MTKWDRRVVVKVHKKTENKCFYCGEELPEDTPFYDDGGKVFMKSRNWHIEHMIPLSRGGTDHVNNLVPSCKNCNTEKSAKTAEEFTNEYNPR